MSDLAIISSDKAPAAVGPYSQAVAHGDVVYCSGAVPIDPATGELIDGEVGAQTERCLQNLAAVCEAAGTALDRAIQVTIYTTRLELFAEINDAYAGYFDSHRPARVTVGVAALPLGAEVEIAATVAR